MKTFSALFFLIFFPIYALWAQPNATHNLTFSQIPTRWDEGIPLGNGLLGCLIWEKEGRLRLALDRADLWDLRPMKGLDRPEFTYQWVGEQLQKGNYGTVQQYFDAPYEQEPGPSKLPGAALEFDIKSLGAVQFATLDLATAICTITWKNGVQFQAFVSAVDRTGWFRWETPGSIEAPQPTMIPPAYGGKSDLAAGGSVAGDDLARLGYHQSMPFIENDIRVYHQPCFGGFSYEVALGIRQKASVMTGIWSISSHFPQAMWAEKAKETVRKARKNPFMKVKGKHMEWWQKFWEKSSIQIPDTLLEKQYYRDIYKFGCLARAEAPMISLQGIWTADNGRLPPWKGDLHHDLNTEMSYWPAYTANHLHGAMSLLNHLESNEKAHLDYTKKHFKTTGLNVPGVETLLGQPMGGWIQYACSPTVSAWLSQHFYMQWRYSMDHNFLKNHAWPWFRATAQHLEELTVINQDNIRVLPLSSSPEIHDNAPNAWFTNTWTNYDLTLATFVFNKTAELAGELGLKKEQAHWRLIAKQLPPFALDSEGGLAFAKGLPYAESHRHFSHAMSIYPFGLVDIANGEGDQNIMQSTLKSLEKYKSDYWTGYSFAWLGNLQARMQKGEKAAEALRIFANGFVSSNSFHVNGDQSGKGYSTFTYRPFTLEGNFAFAAGLQEMLLQSHAGFISVFPAVPDAWTDLSFSTLRANGAVLVSAAKKSGKLERITLQAEVAGKIRLKLEPGYTNPTIATQKVRSAVKVSDNIWEIDFRKGGKADFIF